MSLSFAKGTYQVREAETPADREAALALRAAAFRNGASDADRFDPLCRHILICDDHGPAAAARLLLLGCGAVLPEGYCAQFYDLAPLAAWSGPILELGRFCTRPGLRDPDVLRLGWAAITRIAEETGAELLIGCSSFTGSDWRTHRSGLAHLAARALGPEALRPRPKASVRVDYPAALAGEVGDVSALPPLLRSYLGMGGWVSDHAVIDRDLDTCHVFTALEIAAIPEARRRSLRALAG
ncbi:GNAT family N-acetyltransferase [Thioclava nitratireducens]|uniref:GNAT family N-acetyltransferase n=1 Tax=Thioclava nitratireducens TaxID=1915078 RepID=UPI00248015F6|nr:GNAT family N-acyltransferase [Thioclava nitratireducens]WGT49723.1 GNAT family N-acyltransferase [Thioclava nitratireducens]